MSELLEDLQLYLAALPTNTAVSKLYSLLPREIKMIAYNGKLNAIMSEFYNGLISKESYDIALANLKESLYFFLSRLDSDKLKLLSTGLNLQNGSYNILFVESLPTTENRLQLDVEFSRISNIIDRVNKNRFTLERPLMATTYNKLVEQLNQHQPSIVHFSGHGQTTGIILSTADNKAELIPTAAICRLFSLFKEKTSCVLLNGCYTADMAKALSKEIRHVIGMQYPISDGAAINFAETFYTALCHAPEINFNNAYVQGLTRLLVNNEEQVSTPQMWVNETLYTG
ncbi:CHAT domain-containing protein [Chitinophaga niastensis]|uniref:CHAT domain-containing protein n=1 Tax=Chitinophaga niastensis TaxID=536980 RepID=A0A2P8HGQ3_CHINA|nr:CHAT domain-containing protein [Chitinophaga niastensis]PSL45402.1 CHAT domain-containing protein [Chitinophaga niastensis]